MNKKGFTIVELLAVVSILAIIVLVAVPAFNKYIFKTEDNYYKTLSKSVRTAGMEYMSENSSFLPEQVGYISKIDKQKLIDTGIMEKITDSEGKECEEVKVLVEKKKTGEYEYTTCMKCGSYTSGENICGYDVGEDKGNDKTAPTLASIQISNKTTNSIKVNAVCYDAESKITKYMYSKDNGQTYTTSNKTSHTFTKLEDGKSYTFKIKCVNSVNLEKESISVNGITASLQNPDIKEINNNGFTHAPSREIQITYKDDQITTPEYYFSSSVNVEVPNEVSLCEGTSFPISGTCSGRTTKIEANKWYKTDLKQQSILYDKEGMLIAAIGDGNNLETTNYSSYMINNIDKSIPSLAILSNPLILGNQDYDFKSNVIATFGKSNGNVTCNPGTSKKAGVYNVLCTALGNNGLKAEVTFEVKHNYPAEYVYKICDNTSCGWDTHGHRITSSQGCCSDSSHGCGYPVGGTCSTMVYKCSGGPYNCSYYHCPYGGTLRGTTCYY